MKRQSFALATIGLTAAFVVTAGSGVAIGSGIRTVNADGVISSCVKADSGALRVASSTADCKKSELPLTWKQDGASSAPGRLSVYIDGVLAGPLTSAHAGSPRPEAWYLNSDGVVTAAPGDPVSGRVSTVHYTEPDCAGTAMTHFAPDTYFESPAGGALPQGFYQPFGEEIHGAKSELIYDYNAQTWACGNWDYTETRGYAFKAVERPRIPVVTIR